MDPNTNVQDIARRETRAGAGASFPLLPPHPPEGNKDIHLNRRNLKHIVMQDIY